MTPSLANVYGMDRSLQAVTRREVVFAAWSFAVLALIGGRVSAQQKVVRIGYFSNASGPSFTTEALKKGLHELGYVEGRNLVIEWRSGEGQLERMPGTRGVSARSDYAAAKEDLSHRPRFAQSSKRAGRFPLS